MARKEGTSALESIDLIHTAEDATGRVSVQHWKARGQVVLQQRQDLEASLQARGIDPGEDLRDRVQGRIDLAWAVSLLVLNSILALFVLVIFGPWYLTVPLALLVLVTALPVEEFFQSYDDRDAFREAFFLTLAVLSLGAQLWLGSVRGLFLAALAPAGVGPVTEALAAAAVILRYGLGVLAVCGEALCGYKLYRARKLLCSPTARTIREHRRCSRELVELAARIKAGEVEADIRRAYRQTGARQYLAAEREVTQRTARAHFRRAALGALIALMTLVMLGLLVPAAFAAPRPSRNVVVLLDLSKSVPLDSFRENIEAVAIVLSQLEGQQRILLLGITDSFGRPAILLDRVLPAPGRLGLELRAAREVLIADWRRAAAELRPTYPRTDVLGALALLGYLDDVSGSDTTLILLSDLRQSSRILDIEAADRINVERIIARLKKGSGIPKLPGMQVFLLGVDSSGRSAAYLSDLKSFWLRLFAEAGAQVRQFSITRRVSAPD